VSIRVALYSNRQFPPDKRPFDDHFGAFTRAIYQNLEKTFTDAFYGVKIS
jgi:hypothetical protein